MLTVYAFPFAGLVLKLFYSSILPVPLVLLHDYRVLSAVSEPNDQLIFLLLKLLAFLSEAHRAISLYLVHFSLFFKASRNPE